MSAKGHQKKRRICAIVLAAYNENSGEKIRSNNIQHLSLCSRNVDSTESAEISYEIQNNWGDGFIAAVTVKNTSDKPLEAWKLSFNGNFDICKECCSLQQTVFSPVPVRPLCIAACRGYKQSRGQRRRLRCPNSRI